MAKSYCRTLEQYNIIFSCQTFNCNIFLAGGISDCISYRSASLGTAGSGLILDCLPYRPDGPPAARVGQGGTVLTSQHTSLASLLIVYKQSHHHSLISIENRNCIFGILPCTILLNDNYLTSHKHCRSININNS